MRLFTRLGRFAAFVRDALAVSAALSMILAAAGSLLWLAFADVLVGQLRDLLELDRLASAEDVRALAADVRALSGEDRVIHMPRGRSYVEEPVHVGEAVALILFLKRTSTGASCEFLSGSSVFEDTSGIRMGGSTLRPMQQVSTELRRIRVVLRPPAELRPGRVLVSLILRYRCGDRIVFDETDPIAFRLLPASKP